MFYVVQGLICIRCTKKKEEHERRVREAEERRNGRQLNQEPQARTTPMTGPAVDSWPPKESVIPASIKDILNAFAPRSAFHVSPHQPMGWGHPLMDHIEFLQYASDAEILERFEKMNEVQKNSSPALYNERRDALKAALNARQAQNEDRRNNSQ
jgi:hypothetical protein